LRKSLLISVELVLKTKFGGLENLYTSFDSMRVKFFAENFLERNEQGVVEF
jgi:hypothetical protein